MPVIKLRHLLQCSVAPAISLGYRRKEGGGTASWKAIVSALDVVALLVIFVIIVPIAAVIVALGPLPGKIAQKRGHPHPDAVNAASWIGLASATQGVPLKLQVAGCEMAGEQNAQVS